MNDIPGIERGEDKGPTGFEHVDEMLGVQLEDKDPPKKIPIGHYVRTPNDLKSFSILHWQQFQCVSRKKKQSYLWVIDYMVEYERALGEPINLKQIHDYELSDTVAACDKFFEDLDASVTTKEIKTGLLIDLMRLCYKGIRLPYRGKSPIGETVATYYDPSEGEPQIVAEPKSKERKKPDKKVGKKRPATIGHTVTEKLRQEAGHLSQTGSHEDRTPREISEGEAAPLGPQTIIIASNASTVLLDGDVLTNFFVAGMEFDRWDLKAHARLRELKAQYGLG